MDILNINYTNMFKEQVALLLEKGYVELWRNDNSIYLKNDESEVWVILMEEFSFKWNPTNETITLFDEFKGSKPFLAKKTLCFINEVTVSDREGDDTVEEYIDKVYNDQYFFLKMPMDMLDVIPYEKYDLDIDFIDMWHDEYNYWYESHIENNVYEISPFEVAEGITISGYLRFLYEHRNSKKVYVSFPPALRENSYYFKYLGWAFIKWQFKFTWAK